MEPTQAGLQRSRPAWGRPWNGFLRRPAVIVAELFILTAACVAGACLPQVGRSPAAELARLYEHGRLAGALVRGLALDHVFTSFWFLAVLALAAASLAIVVVEQGRRLHKNWHQGLTEAHFRSAPFRHTFIRPRRGGEKASVTVRRRARLGHSGSLLFHAGLLCVILGGGLSALFGVQAVVDVYEGEVLPATPEAWAGQWPGPLGRPFRLDEPLRLVSVETTQYATGQLKNLHLKLAHEDPARGPVREMGINEDLQVRRGRLYPGAEHGPAALVEWRAPTMPEVRTALLLEKKEPRAYGGYAQGPGRLQARIRVPFGLEGGRPDHAEVRVRDGAKMLAEGVLRPGEALALPDGSQVKLCGLPFWARLHGSRDPALGLVYLGFALALLGAIGTYLLVPVDEWVAITPEGTDERVVVALRPHRFEPLFRERFERLVRDHGGEV